MCFCASARPHLSCFSLCIAYLLHPLLFHSLFVVFTWFFWLAPQISVHFSSFLLFLPYFSISTSPSTSVLRFVKLFSSLLAENSESKNILELFSCYAPSSEFEMENT
uniref:Secreted protein n=1 Tax=Echinococcus granulosus TaxID=6210 RepID=A0A068WR06_ECHGR|nr:hypothetical protein EgrG_000343600 [Echinococcus granulosus]